VTPWSGKPSKASNSRKAATQRQSKRNGWRIHSKFKARRNLSKNIPSNSILVALIALIFLALSNQEVFSISFLKEQFNEFISKAPSRLTDSRATSILSGRITHVRDGDTFEVNGVPVRISALDCAENRTKEGQKITRYAKRFKGKRAVCEITGKDKYNRSVGYCSIDGKDFAQTMMDNTSCKLWAKYDVWNRY
jgi:hypothetical protein